MDANLGQIALPAYPFQIFDAPIFAINIGDVKRLATTAPKRKNRVPVRVEAVDFVMYCSKDVLKLRAWYKDIFGLGKGGEWNAQWSEFATKPVTFCLNGPSSRPDPAWDWSGTPAIAFAVPDIHVAARAMIKRRVKILKGPVETRVCWMLFAEDPDGNRLVLHQRKDGTCG